MGKYEDQKQETKQAKNRIKIDYDYMSKGCDSKAYEKFRTPLFHLAKLRVINRFGLWVYVID